MTVGSLVGIPELQAEGPARIMVQRQGWCEITFLRSGAEMTIEQHAVMRYVLLPGTAVRITGSDDQCPIGEVLPQQSSQDLVRYRLHKPSNPALAIIDESQIDQVIIANDPGRQLREVAFHDLAVSTTKTGKPRAPEPWGPQTLCARETVLAWADALWHHSGGVLGLSGARIDLLPHQILTAQRVLSDGQIRFLLADEVGLGKTIEAGLILQSLLAMNPRLRVLIVAPGALVGQWFLELFIKFGGRRFTMFDSQRLEEHADPWNEQFIICSARALEDLSPRQALRFATTAWDVVIMDECHRMQPGGILYQRMSVLSRQSPHVLLLSATPPRQHARAYLAILHLLQPDAYPLDQVAAFRSKMDRAHELSQLIRRLEDDDGDQPSAIAAARSLLAKDQRVLDLLDSDQLSAAVTWLKEHYVPDHRVIRHRRGSLAQLAAHSGIKPLNLGVRTRQWCTYDADAAENAVRDQLAAYRHLLLTPYLDDVSAAPPRLLHWLLQLEQAASAHPAQLAGLLAMRAAVLEDPEEFAEYRLRAHRDEQLSAVLRSDGSDSELATQVAISAASHVEHSEESALLSALQEATGQWAKHLPQRLKALLKSLKAFWKEQPQEKVLVFTTHASSLRHVYDYLAKQVGAAHVADFGAHQEAEEREASATRFRTVDDCWVLVCDALGGEGRNFQFVSMVAHYDLPWSVSAVEQRIGRVDRLGRDGEVLSLVCRSSDAQAIDGAWAEVLDEVIDIFQRSSSGLEFMAAGLETHALHAALAQGGDCLRALMPQLLDQVRHERQLLADEEDDGFSLSAKAFAAAQATADALSQLQPPIPAICRWLRSMGGRARADDDHPGHHHLRGRGAHDYVQGTFSAQRAQRHQEHAFFARGHQLIDEVVDSAANASWCLANAWLRKPADGAEAWEGLRGQLRLNLDLVPLLTAQLPLETLRRIWMTLPQPPTTLCVSLGGQHEEREAVLNILNKPFDAYRGDKAFSSQVSRALWMRPLVSGKGAQIMTWQQRIHQTYQRAQSIAQQLSGDYLQPAQARLEEHLQRQEAVLTGRLQVASDQWGEAHPDTRRLDRELAAERQVASCLRAVLAGAKLQIATVAYIKVV